MSKLHERMIEITHARSYIFLYNMILIFMYVLVSSFMWPFVSTFCIILVVGNVVSLRKEWVMAISDPDEE